MLTVTRKKNRHPAKILLETFGPFRVYQVDGDRVRNSTPGGQEFGESASHFTMPLVVPDGEVWIEDDVPPADRPFVISGAIRIAASRDYAAGPRFVKHLRENEELAGTEWPGEWLSAECYVRELGTLPNGVEVWLVDGDKVRAETKTDFQETGHDLVNPWLPPKTIIIENGPQPDELAIQLDHVASERRRMANGMGYPRAHLYATKEEFTARQHGAPDWAVELVTLGKCVAGEPMDAICSVCGQVIEPEATCDHAVRSASIQRTIYAAAGPGRPANDSTPGELAMPFGHLHQARIVGLPVQFDQVTGPQMVEPGIRITWAMQPQTLDKLPTLVQFDSEKFSEDEARTWLSEHGVREYEFQADARDKTPATQGNPRDEGEEPPQGFSDLNSFYAATIPQEPVKT